MWRIVGSMKVLGVALQQTTFAEEKDAPIELKEFCKEHACRRNVAVKLRTGGDDIDITLPLYWPAIEDDRISLLPGEELLVEAELNGDKLVALKQVQQADHPEKTIELKFEQSEDGLDMRLLVRNPFKAPLKYHADMFDFSHTPHQTTSCPVHAGIFGVESWPQPIPEIVLSDLHLWGEKDELECVY
jgi:hypothetical protein